MLWKWHKSISVDEQWDTSLSLVDGHEMWISCYASSLLVAVCGTDSKIFLLRSIDSEGGIDYVPSLTYEMFQYLSHKILICSGFLMKQRTGSTVCEIC